MTTTTTPTPASERKVPTRRVSFEEALADLPKHFAAHGDVIASHLMASLSSVFPDGEDFFVRSVRNFRDRIDDPVLKRQVAGFIGQEAMHGREHRALNGRLDELGYPAKRVERFTKWGLETRERFLPPVSNLAATAALEHFTATFAEVLLSSEAAREQVGDTVVRDILLWHALEESEHKAVAFDVYKAVGGSERLRVLTMNLLTFGFLGGMAVQTFVSLLGDRDFYRWGPLKESWGRFVGSPFLSRGTWRRLRDYNRPDFHPDDHDNAALVDAWRDELFGAEGRLNDKLAGAGTPA
jgi:predicted metal-dependent hydrolase